MSELRQKRFVGLDLHQHSVMVAGLNAQQEVVLRPCRVELVALETWVQKHLSRSDEVVLEATSNAWWAYDLLEPLVGRVVVASPHQVQADCGLIGQNRQKRCLDLGSAALG